MERKSWPIASSGSAGGRYEPSAAGGDDLEAAEDDDADERERECEHHDVLLSAAGSRASASFALSSSQDRGQPVVGPRARRIALSFPVLAVRAPRSVKIGSAGRDR